MVTAEMLEPTRLDAFYSADATASWRAVLGEKMHYHHGMWLNGDAALDSATIDAAMERAVTTLLPFIEPGSRVLDVGSGWCGPLGIFADVHGCNVTGVTISSRQADHCREMGRSVVLGNIEANATKAAAAGQYGTAVLLESLTHVRDKPTLLRWLRSQAPRLVLRVNTRPADEVHADQAPSVVFGDSMTLPTAAELKQVLEAAGWRIKHWQNERTAATPTLDAYRTRLDTLPVSPGNNTQLELLRSLVELNDQRKSNNGSWTVTHGLLTVVAVSGDAPKRTSATHRRAGDAAVVPSACEASLDEAVAQLERLLSVATQADVLPVPKGKLGFTDLFHCVATALRRHADDIRVPTSDGAANSDRCPDAAFWRRQLLRLSSKTRLDASTGRVVASINRYSVGVPRTLNSSIQRQVARSCMVTAMAAPRSVMIGMLNATEGAAKLSGDAGEGLPIELGVAWPNADRVGNELPSGRLYVGKNDHDDITAVEWTIDGTAGRGAAPRGYRKAPAGQVHTSCVQSALATATPAKHSLAKAISAAEGCWVSDRGVTGVKHDLRLASPISVVSLEQELHIELPVAQSKLATELGVAVTVIAVQPDAFTLYFQHIDVPLITPSPLASAVGRTLPLIPMPGYPLPVSQGKLSLIPAADRIVFFRDIFGRRSHHFKSAGSGGSGGVRTVLGGLDFRAMLGAAHERLQVRWKTDGDDVNQESRVKLEEDLDATWRLLTTAPPESTSIKGQLSAVLTAVETYTADWALRKLHNDLMDSFGLAIGINAYFSAPKATALRPHTDPYDVLVIQLQGTKRWHVCSAVLDDVLTGASMTESDRVEVLELKRRRPLGCTRIDNALDDPELACKEMEVGPGDVVYLPKGVVHTATTVNDTLSVHLTISLKRDGVRWGDLFSAVCGENPHAGCPSLDTVAATAPAGVAWLRPFPIWLGAGATKTPEVLRHFAQLRHQLEHFDDANHHHKAMLEGHIFDGAALPRVTVAKLLDALENGWEGSLGGRKLSDPEAILPPPFMRVDSATGRVRRDACNAGALFQCPDGQLHSYQYISPTDCDSCDTPRQGISCGCDGYCENNATSLACNQLPPAPSAAMWPTRLKLLTPCTPYASSSNSAVDGSSCGCDSYTRQSSCDQSCDRYLECRIRCTLCTCPAGQVLRGCTTVSVGTCEGPTSAPSTTYPTFEGDTFAPTVGPSSSSPTSTPTTSSPTVAPTAGPTDAPTTAVPTASPTALPTSTPTTHEPTRDGETFSPTTGPTRSPSTLTPTTSTPTDVPTSSRPTTSAPTLSPTFSPTSSPTMSPSASPTTAPTVSPTISPTDHPTTSGPTQGPTRIPTSAPSTHGPTQLGETFSPTRVPTRSPSTSTPTASPTVSPTVSPTTSSPTDTPTRAPSNSPTASPTLSPTTSPTIAPTASPTLSPTVAPTGSPTTSDPTQGPTRFPTSVPSTHGPTRLGETFAPTRVPSRSPSTSAPTTGAPTRAPTKLPSLAPTTSAPTSSPTASPTTGPTTSAPTASPVQGPGTECNNHTDCISGLCLAQFGQVGFDNENASGQVGVDNENATGQVGVDNENATGQVGFDNENASEIASLFCCLHFHPLCLHCEGDSGHCQVCDDSHFISATGNCFRKREVSASCTPGSSRECRSANCVSAGVCCPAGVTSCTSSPSTVPTAMPTTRPSTDTGTSGTRSEATDENDDWVELLVIVVIIVAVLVLFAAVIRHRHRNQARINLGIHDFTRKNTMNNPTFEPGNVGVIPKADGGNEGGEVVDQGMNNPDPAPDDGEEEPVYEDMDNANQPHNVANDGQLDGDDDEDALYEPVEKRGKQRLVTGQDNGLVADEDLSGYGVPSSEPVDYEEVIKAATTFSGPSGYMDLMANHDAFELAVGLRPNMVYDGTIAPMALYNGSGAGATGGNKTPMPTAAKEADAKEGQPNYNASTGSGSSNYSKAIDVDLSVWATGRGYGEAVEMTKPAHACNPPYQGPGANEPESAGVAAGHNRNPLYTPQDVANESTNAAAGHARDPAHQGTRANEYDTLHFSRDHTRNPLCTPPNLAKESTNVAAGHARNPAYQGPGANESETCFSPGHTRNPLYQGPGVINSFLRANILYHGPGSFSLQAEVGEYGVPLERGNAAIYSVADPVPEERAGTQGPDSGNADDDVTDYLTVEGAQQISGEYLDVACVDSVLGSTVEGAQQISGEYLDVACVDSVLGSKSPQSHPGIEIIDSAA